MRAAEPRQPAAVAGVVTRVHLATADGTGAWAAEFPAVDVLGGAGLSGMRQSAWARVVTLHVATSPVTTTTPGVVNLDLVSQVPSGAPTAPVRALAQRLATGTGGVLVVVPVPLWPSILRVSGSGLAAGERVTVAVAVGTLPEAVFAGWQQS